MENQKYALTLMNDLRSGVCQSHMVGQENGRWSFDGNQLMLRPDSWENRIIVCNGKPSSDHGRNPPRMYAVSAATLEEVRVGHGAARLNRGLVLNGPCSAQLEPGCNANSLDSLTHQVVNKEVILQRLK